MKIFRILRGVAMLATAFTDSSVHARELCGPTDAPGISPSSNASTPVTISQSSTTSRGVYPDTLVQTPPLVPTSAVVPAPAVLPTFALETPSIAPATPPTAPETLPNAPETPPTAPETLPTAPATPPSGGGIQMSSGTVKSFFGYTGKNAGGPGTYDMVTDLATCAKEPRTTSNPVSPLDEEVSLVFRGPMTIANIAVFDGASGAWTRVSSYEKDSASADNMVFLNNKNIDFSGKSSPEGFSSADGRSVVAQPTPFGGVLGAASNPTGASIFPDEKTGVEVHVMTSKKCDQDDSCLGYHDTDGTAHHGWGGGKKVFVTKVTMPDGGAPNIPAIWMLNAQVVRSNQYQCNCRGVGKAGGCGELDIAEVLDKDTRVVATHYYFFGGSPAPGHDTYGKRATDGYTTYITIIDESSGVFIIEIGADDFDFSATSISSDVIQNWIQMASSAR